MEPLTRTPSNLPALAGKIQVQERSKPVPIKILNPTDEDIGIRNNTNVRFITRLSSHVRQMAPAEGAEGYKDVLNAGRPLGPELQAWSTLLRLDR